MQDTLLSFWGLFVSAFISATLAPGGSEAVLAYLVAQKTHPLEQLLSVAAIGNTLGAMTTWGLGALAARKYPAESLLPVKKQNALKTLENRGQWVLFFSWLPIVGDALCFAGGWLRLPFVRGCLIIFAGKLCRYAVVAWLFA